jgi:hypothetical protein
LKNVGADSNGRSKVELVELRTFSRRKCKAIEKIMREISWKWFKKCFQQEYLSK